MDLYCIRLVLSHMGLDTWSKNYWADCKKVSFFLNPMFLAVRNFKFQYDPFSDLNCISQMVRLSSLSLESH
jgi:hypothetical protein